MDQDELNELQHPETWEDGEDECRPAVKSPRAVVSVAFTREDFQQVAAYARQHGMKTSEFIRRATLESMSLKRDQAVVGSVRASPTGQRTTSGSVA